MNFNKFSNQILRVIDADIPAKKYISIDISKSNEELKYFDVSSSKEWIKYINNYLEKNQASVAFGGYLETRDIYSRSDYFKSKLAEDERNIHLGIDFWCSKNTKVLSVLEGEIHSFKYNDNHGDYGPTIIIEHHIDDEIFYSLYGHLTTSSIKNLKVGQFVNRGEVIAFLGDSIENGDYAPHLHFQLIKDLQGNFGDYPGVCSLKEVEFYKTNCPNPNLLLNL